MVFPVVMCGCKLNYKESWVPKNWCFWTVVLEKILASRLDCKEIQPEHPKGNQSWIFIGRTDVEAETPILWPPIAKNWLIWKDPDAGKDWGQEEKEMTNDEMVGWHHRLNGHEWVNSGSWWWTGRPGVLQSMGMTKSQTQLSDWTEQYIHFCIWCLSLSIRLWKFIYVAKYVKSSISFFHRIVFHCGYTLGEGNGTPLQYSCLENPMDEGAW